ncbi:MAG: uroporphyrinogen decarboxylase family protein, partial [Sulfurimonadaceae bacterium]|nr:uroporphyrinogen decarboxylase family protein [Sulfurimonadaceae bacterium]
GRRLIDYVKSGEVAAASQIDALRHYDYDAVFAIFDACVETEAAGSTIEFRDDIYPAVTDFVIKPDTDPEKLKLPDPEQDGRMPELLKCVSTLRKKVGEKTLVIGTTIGPTTVLTQLMGMQQALFLAIDEPERFEKMFNYAEALVRRFGEAQLKAGAHLVLTFDPTASQTVVPPQFYREFILPRHARLFKAYKEAGAIANWIHSAGRIHDILPFYKQTGVEVANFDFEVDAKTAAERVGNICLDGNIKPLSFVYDNPQSIRVQSLELLRFFKERGGFILSSGCEIPPEAKPENITAMVMAAREEY